MFYTPIVGSALRELQKAPALLIGRVDACIDQHLWLKSGKDVAPSQDGIRVELLIGDEAEHLSTAALEYLRDQVDRHGLGLIPIGMPGSEKRMAR